MPIRGREGEISDNVLSQEQPSAPHPSLRLGGGTTLSFTLAKQGKLFIKSITQAGTLNHTQYETAKTVLSADLSNKCNLKLLKFAGTVCLFTTSASSAATDNIQFRQIKRLLVSALQWGFGSFIYTTVIKCTYC